MDRRAVIIGGSVGGLGAALGLARRGWSVTVVERDPDCPTDSGDEAYLTWERPHVPQFRQPHAFSARSRNLLLQYAPDVVEWLRADGVEENNLFKLLAPKEMWTPEDDAYTGLMTRRPAFELALRRGVQAQAGINLLSPALVSGLLFDASAGSVPRVTGVRLDDGRELSAGVVLDCGGRRTPVPKWLEAMGVKLPTEIQDCESSYYTRYYRKVGTGMPMIAIFGIGGEAAGAFAFGFAGDHDTFGIGIFARPDDDELHALRHGWAWDAVARSFPTIAPWIDPAHATPLLDDVQVMSGHQNVRRRFVVDGEPLVLGILPVGDSLCTTNPQYGWGASMALTYAFAAVEALSVDGRTAHEVAMAYDASVADEADGVYRESAAMDRMRIYRERDEEIPEWDAEAMKRQDLIQRGVGGGSRFDPILGRAFLRRSNLLDRPDAVLDDPQVVERAEHSFAIVSAKEGRRTGPTREELLVILADAKPSDTPALL